jgi:hypothetical protein
VGGGLVKRHVTIILIGLIMITPGVVSEPIDSPSPYHPGRCPMMVFGHAYYNGVILPQGEVITAWIDGTKYAESVVYDPEKCYCLYIIFDDLYEKPKPPPGNKTGGYWGDLITFSYVNGNETFIADETATWTLAGVEIMDLHFCSVAQPAQLKINEICTEDNSGLQFVTIYNPASTPVSLDDYYLQKDVENSGCGYWAEDVDYNGASVCLNGIADIGIPYFVDLGAAGFLNSTDELKLVWENPGSNTAQGNDVVIDRVEYGNQPFEPDDTIMPDSIPPVPSWSIKRVPDGQDTENCTTDFQLFEADLPSTVDLSIFDEDIGLYDENITIGEIVTISATVYNKGEEVIQFHDPIRINSNADFDTAHGVSGGNGSETNPWIIENLDINGTGPGYCLFIGNTTDHFIVRNCRLHDTNGPYSYPII